MEWSRQWADLLKNYRREAHVTDRAAEPLTAVKRKSRRGLSAYRVTISGGGEEAHIYMLWSPQPCYSHLPQVTLSRSSAKGNCGAQYAKPKNFQTARAEPKTKRWNGGTSGSTRPVQLNQPALARRMALIYSLGRLELNQRGFERAC